MKHLNIYMREDGRWEGRIYHTEPNTNIRRYHAFFGHTREETEEKMRTFKARQSISPAISITFFQLYKEWEQANRHRIKESTAANYTLKANKHLLPEFGSTQAVSISTANIYDFIRKKQNENLSNRYISDILILMKSIFKYGTIKYQYPNPMEGISMPKKQKAEIRLLNTEEQRKLEQYIAKNQNLTTLGIAMAKSTGLRIGELCALQWEDIDIEKRILTVRKTIQRIQVKNGIRKTKIIITDPKSDTSRRTIPIPEFMIVFLKKFRGKAKNFVLSGNEKPIEPRTMQYRFARILKNGNLPSVHFHALRHMFATNCIKLGFDVKALSEILGHSGVEITLNRYVHSSFEQKVEYMDRLKMIV